MIHIRFFCSTSQYYVRRCGLLLLTE